MSTQPLAIVILAAGKGSRMKSDLPKAMHKLAGKPMINWLLDTADTLNPEKIVVVCGPNMPELEKAVQPHISVIQDTQDGTASATKIALQELKGFTGDIVVLLGDVPLITSQTIKDLIAQRHADMLVGLSVLGMEKQDPFGYGRLVITKDGRVKKIVEEKDASPKQKEGKICNAGAFCIDGKRAARWLNLIGNNNAQNEYYLTDLPVIANKDGTLCYAHIVKDNQEVKGCNSKADLAALEKTLQNRLRTKLMEEGVTMQDPDSVYLHHDTKIASGCFIAPNVYFGPGVVVEENVEIKPYCHLEGTTIGKGTSLGPFARIRPDTTIGKNVKIGNFVEIKKSSIGANSKISHLAYVGDCLMGEGVNFSCGAITVNYDGFQKHKTVIGKNVMVGSNVNLVAPVSVDDGAFIAAGSTITEDVPADALSLERGSNTIREGWAAAFREKKDALKKKKAQKKQKTTKAKA